MKEEKNLKFIKGKEGKPGYYVTEITLNYRRVRRFAGWTKEEARARLAELRLASKRGELEETIKPSTPADLFGDYARGLLDSAEWKAKRSHARDEGSLMRLNAAFRGVRLAEINPGIVRKYVTGRQEGDGVSPATVNRELSFLKIRPLPGRVRRPHSFKPDPRPARQKARGE